MKEPASLKEKSAANVDSRSTKDYNKKVVRVEYRDNRGLSHLPKEMKQEGFLVLNSSYT